MQSFVMWMRHVMQYPLIVKHTLIQGATSRRFISSALVGEALALKTALIAASSSIRVKK